MRAERRWQAWTFWPIPMTGRENVEMVGRLYGLSSAESTKRADEVLDRIGLAGAADRQVKTYSGGMQRRLDLAASLVGRPQVLFLDEPTTGIDPGSRIDVWELISDLVDGGTTVLLTTQYLDEADQLADRIAVIDEGRLITEGTSDDLKDTLGGSVIELSVPQERLGETLASLREICGSEPKFDELTREITVPAAEGAKTLTEVVRVLDGAGIGLHDIALHKPSLDDVFLALTGHKAEREEAEQPNGRRSRRRRKP
jgi:ABC-type multidrug transport system ATPase subunit